MNKSFIIALFTSILFNNNCIGQVTDSTIISDPYAFARGQLFLSPGVGFAKNATSFGAGIEYGLTNVVGVSLGFSNASFIEKNYYTNNTIRATAVGLGFNLHTAYRKKRIMFDFMPGISFSKLLRDSYYVEYPRLGVAASAEYRLFVSKVVAFNFSVGKALNGAKKWGIGGGLTFRLIN